MFSELPEVGFMLLFRVVQPSDRNRPIIYSGDCRIFPRRTRIPIDHSGLPIYEFVVYRTSVWISRQGSLNDHKTLSQGKPRYTLKQSCEELGHETGVL
jgi:hypothetical protein